LRVIKDDSSRRTARLQHCPELDCSHVLHPRAQTPPGASCRSSLKPSLAVAVLSYTM
jgi:hypothetical protein